jgi:signal transduction histidine kinase/serine phosphatase RsbU (regulator of sigma subunit)
MKPKSPLKEEFLASAEVRKNIEALRWGASAAAVAVSIFWALDWVVARNHVWLFFILRFGCVAYCLWQIYVIRTRREWVAAHVQSLGVSAALLTGCAISIMAWMHDGYESPYYAGLSLTVIVASWLYVWKATATIMFDVVLYSFYMAPLVLGIIPIKNHGAFFSNQFFLLTTMALSCVSWWHTYGEEQKQFQTQFELEEAKAILEITNLKLQELDSVKTQFFANVSHELRTPLTLSLGPVEAMLGEEAAAGGGSERAARLEMVRRNQLRLLKLINDLLDFSKLEAGKMRLVFQPTEIGAQLESLVAPVREAATTRGIAVSLALPPKPLMLYVDREKFERVVLNLLSNAYKFTPDGGSISVALKEVTGHAEITVSDTGIGIAQDKISNIFERFSQVDASATRKYAGTGIGLAMVKEYTELHHGSIEVKSEPGRGSTFVVRIPVGKVHLDPQTIDEDAASMPLATFAAGAEAPLAMMDFVSDARDSVPELHVPTARVLDDAPVLGEEARLRLDEIESSILQQARVLVVDDSADMRVHVRSLLAPTYEVFVARDGREGLALAEKLRPDLIVSDVMMPELSGEELCRLIKTRTDGLQTTAVMLLTARTDQSTKLEGLGHGADDYLFKPFNPLELQLRVRNLVRQRRHAKALRIAHHELAEKKRVLDADLQMARAFQQSLLSSVRTIHAAKVGVRYEPAALVGGDYYDIHILSKDKARIFLADATDHGVQAAMRTMMIKSEYDRLKARVEGPAQLLTELNRTVFEHYPVDPSGYLGSSVSFAALCVDIERTGPGLRLRVSSGGSEPPQWAHGERVDELFVAGVTLGRLPTYRYQEHSLEVAAGDRVYLYSDGITEQTDASGHMYSGERLQSAIALAQRERDLDAALQSVLRSWQAFKQNTETRDDVTLLVLEA